MRSNTLIKNDGMRILVENLGIIEAERFITLILREPCELREIKSGIFYPLRTLRRRSDAPLRDFSE